MVEAKDTHYPQQEEFTFILILMSTGPSVFHVDGLSLWVTATFSVEDLVIVVPGTRQLEQLLSLCNTYATVSCFVSPLQKMQFCAQLCGYRGQSLFKS